MIQKSYFWLERRFPTSIKRIIPERWRIWLGYQIKIVRDRSAGYFAQLYHPLVLPHQTTEAEIYAYLEQFYIETDGYTEERKRYLREAFKRFLYTLALVPDGSGELLEIGANPYFMTLLLARFRNYQVQLINYFGAEHPDAATQVLVGEAGQRKEMAFANVDVEREVLPFSAETISTVLLCEVIEHFAHDPQHALLEINRVLQPGGTLILTTPNVARLENVARLLKGHNLYDPYSGHGPAGRHNREYTVAELRQLLEHVGFEVEQIFTSDVYDNHTNHIFHHTQFNHLLTARQGELGQYIFVKAVKRHGGQKRRPRWLYRHYLDSELI